MTNCPRCNAPVLQGYDHCTNCGLAFQPVRAQQQPQMVPPSQPQGGFAPPAPQNQNKSSSGSAFPYALAAKIDTQGFIWMITGVVQVVYAIVSALSYLLIFINCSSALSRLTQDQVSAISYYRQNQIMAVIVIIAMVLLAVIGFLNFTDGKKRKENAGWVIANPNLAIDEFSPIQSYLPALIRNLAFFILLGLNLSGTYFPARPALVGLLGIFGLGYLLYIRYTALKQIQPPSR